MDTYHLLGYHDHRLDGELSVAVVEQVLQAGAEEVNDQNVVEALLAKVIDIRDPGCNKLVMAGRHVWCLSKACVSLAQTWAGEWSKAAGPTGGKGVKERQNSRQPTRIL